MLLGLSGLWALGAVQFIGFSESRAFNHWKQFFTTILPHDHASKTPTLSLVPTAINSINIKASTLVSFT